VDDRQIAGEYDYSFEAGKLASGIYFCNLKTDTNIETWIDFEERSGF